MNAIDWLFWWTGALLWASFLGMVAIIIAAGIVAAVSNRRDEKLTRDQPEWLRERQDDPK